VKYLITAVLVSSILCVPSFGAKRSADFQKGQILKFERLSGQLNPNGYAESDAPPDSGVYRYNLLVQVGDTTFTAQLESSDPMDAEFSSGSEVQIRASKRVLYLKRASGAVVEASIVGRRKADAN
jgi:hypothetical protein